MSRGFDAAERTWEMQSLARHYGRPEPEEDERISVTVYGPDGEVLADTRQVTWNGRKATVLDEYLDELKRGESLLDADTLEALLRGRRPDARGRLDVELTAEEAKTLRPNPLKRRKGESERDFMARCMSAEKRKFPQPKQRVAVCLSKARRNPAGSGAVLLFKGSRLVLAEDSDEENRLRAGGWDEAGDKVVRKLAKLRSLDKNGWAELTDRPFTERELGDALRSVERQNPAERLRIGDVVMGVQGVDGGYVGVVESLSADHSGKPIVSFRGEDGVLRETYLFNVTKNVPSSGKFPRKNPAVTGERGQYRLHYMEPGARKGTFRQAIRRVNSVAEAERWMNDNAGRAFLPASVMTPGNRWQSPDVVAVLGSDRRLTSTKTSYDRLPV